MSEEAEHRFNHARRQWDNIAVIRTDGVTRSYLNGSETSEIFIAAYTFDPLNPWGFPEQKTIMR